MMIEPLNTNVLLKPIEAKDTTDSGLAIPDSADKEVPQEGEVVKLPNLEKFLENYEPTEEKSRLAVKTIQSLNVGDRVLYGKYSGEDVTVDGEDFKIVDISGIRAKVIR